MVQANDAIYGKSIYCHRCDDVSTWVAKASTRVDRLYNDVFEIASTGYIVCGKCGKDIIVFSASNVSDSLDRE